MSFGQSKSKSDSAAKTREQTQALSQALGAFSPRIGQPQTSFGGERVAGQTATQQQAVGGAGDFLDAFAAGRESPILGTAGDALTGLLQGQGGGAQIDPQRAGEIFDITRAQPALRDFERFTGPLIAEAFAGSNFDSSARANALALEGERLTQALRGEREEFLFGTEESNRQLQEAAANRALSAVGVAPQTAGAETAIESAKLQGRSDVFDFASQEQFQRQAEINADIQRFQESIAFMDPNDFTILATLLGLDFSRGSGSSSSLSIGTS